MPSERYKLKVNVNDSKNTRMDIDNSFAQMDFRKDELMHLGRYFRACQTMIDLSKQLGRSVKVLDIGCGELFIPRVFYKSFLVKKSSVIQTYFGIDIDNIMLDRCKNKYEALIQACNIKLLCRDLTVNSTFKLKDESIDLVCWFENIEHMKPEFIEPIVKEVSRVLNKNHGIALISTPNSEGSNFKLPKDHVFEWSYTELIKLLSKYFQVDPVGVGLNISKIPKEEREKNSRLIHRIYRAFGDNTAFSSVALAPFFSPQFCKNVLYICTYNGGQ